MAVSTAPRDVRSLSDLLKLVSLNVKRLMAQSYYMTHCYVIQNELDDTDFAAPRIERCSEYPFRN
jgi:hypothetical protein